MSSMLQPDSMNLRSVTGESVADLSFPNWVVIFRSCVLFTCLVLLSSSYPRAILSSMLSQEGPAFVLQIFGLCDVCVKMVTTGCWYWMAIGIGTGSILIGFLCFGIYKSRVLVARGSVEFSPYPCRSLTILLKEARHTARCTTGLMVVAVGIHDMRFKGEWAKNSDSARHWGWLLSNTGGLWLFFALAPARRILTSIVVNVSEPSVNAIGMVVVFWTGERLELYKLYTLR